MVMAERRRVQLSCVLLAGLLPWFASCTRLRAAAQRGAGDVSSHDFGDGDAPQHLSFTQVLATSMKSDAFQKQVQSTVPMLCDGADQPDQCKNTITKALVCTSFVEKAKQFPKDMDGITAFINKCDRIERAVPNFSSVVHWIQTPDALFQQAVTRAEARTGISLGAPLTGGGAPGILDTLAPADNGDADGDGLPPINPDPDADVASLPPLPQ